MKLTDLKIEDKGFIKDIKLETKLKKKLMEMGFVENEEIKIINVSPFNNSIIVQIMDYKLQLSLDEAKNIEVTKKKNINTINCNNNKEDNIEFTKLKNWLYENKCDLCCKNCTKYKTNETIDNIKLALVGNPNCGKTTLFNLLTNKNEYTGNYSGVTVDVKNGIFNFDNYKICIYDLPGVYSLSEYYNEEKITIDFLKEEKLDLVINIIDSTKLKRSLFLTYELKNKFNFIMCALNLYDEFKSKGYNIDLDKFENNFEVFAVPIISKNGIGINNLIKKSIDIVKYIKMNNILNNK